MTSKSILNSTIRSLRASSSPSRLSSALRPRHAPTPSPISALSSALLFNRRLPQSSSTSLILSRAAHSIPRPPPSQPRAPAQDKGENKDATAVDANTDLGFDTPTGEGERPELRNPAYYQLSFTCLPCGYRSHHNVSKQGYHHGAVLITCPECRNRHVISDHLGIFGERNVTVEQLMQEKGRLVKKGSLGEDGDIEFWPDEQEPDPQLSGETNKP